MSVAWYEPPKDHELLPEHECECEQCIFQRLAAETDVAPTWGNYRAWQAVRARLNPPPKEDEWTATGFTAAASLSGATGPTGSTAPPYPLSNLSSNLSQPITNNPKEQEHMTIAVDGKVYSATTRVGLAWVLLRIAARGIWR